MRNQDFSTYNCMDRDTTPQTLRGRTVHCTYHPYELDDKRIERVVSTHHIQCVFQTIRLISKLLLQHNLRTPSWPVAPHPRASPLGGVFKVIDISTQITNFFAVRSWRQHNSSRWWATGDVGSSKLGAKIMSNAE